MATPALTAEESHINPIPLSDLEPLEVELQTIGEAMMEYGVVSVPTLSPAQQQTLSQAISECHNAVVEADKADKSRYAGQMISLFYLPQKELLVTSNPRIYRAILAAYRTFAPLREETIDRLTISRAERVNIKPPKSAYKLPGHVDVNIYSDSADHLTTLPGTRIQGMQVATIADWDRNQENGTLVVVKRFHRYARLAARALHPVTGVEGMRIKKPEHTKGPIHSFIQLPNVRLEAFSLYIRFVEAFVHLPDGATLGSLPTSGAVERVKVDLIRAHAQKTAQELGLEQCFPVIQKPLGSSLKWEPVSDAQSGSLVLWDSLIPHSNVQNEHPTIPRIVAYIDLAPLERPNNTGAAARVAMMKQLSAGGSRGAAARNKGEAYLIDSQTWRRLADKMKVGTKVGSQVWTTDGQYAHVRPDNRLICALYGYDPVTHQAFGWKDYERLDASGDDQ